MPSFIQSTANNISHLALSMTFGASIGYFLTRSFTRISPVQGGVLAAVTILFKSLIMDRIFNKIFQGPGATAESRLVGHLASFAVSCAIVGVASTAIGFPITFSAGVIVWGSCLAGEVLTIVALAVVAQVAKTVS